MQIVVLAGGVGGSRFTAGVRAAYPDATITIIGNTADDVTIHGLRVCPDLDTLMYTLGGGGDTERGWGRLDESWRAVEELRAYGAEPTWFGLGDRDLGTHLVRTQLLAAGVPLSQVTTRLCARWWAHDPGLRLLPMTDDPVETYVDIPDADAPGGRRSVHFQEYWVRLHAGPEALAIVQRRHRRGPPGARGRGGPARRRPRARRAQQPGRVDRPDPGRAGPAGGPARGARPR